MHIANPIIWLSDGWVFRFYHFFVLSANCFSNAVISWNKVGALLKASIPLNSFFSVKCCDLFGLYNKLIYICAVKGEDCAASSCRKNQLNN